jgi:hypothetical protein
MTQLDILDTEQTAEFLHMKPATLRFWRHKGVGPHFFSMGGRKVFYRMEDLEEWVHEQFKTQPPRRGAA